MALLVEKENGQASRLRDNGPAKMVRRKAAGPKCRHCGIPTASESEAFCCSGCAYVYRLVHEEGFDAYYRIKDTVTAPADAALLPSRDYGWLGEAQARAETAAGDSTPHLTLDVQGISCAGCVWLIEKIFQKQPGAGRIDVNAQVGQVRLSWERGFEAEAFARTLQSFNYLLSPASAARSVAPQSRRLVKKIGLCAAFAMNVMLYTLPAYFGMEATYKYARLFDTLSLVFATLSLLAGGGYFLNRGYRSLREGAMNIDLPIALGITGAYAGSFVGWVLGDARYIYFDFVSTFILLMLVGRWAQLAAVERNQRRLLAEQPAQPQVRVLLPDGGQRKCAIEELTEGMCFMVAPGNTVPVEARLATATASMSLAWINGESAPRSYRAGQRIPSGAVNLARTDVELVATQPWSRSLLAELMKPVQRVKSRNRLIDRVIQGYLIAIISIAGLAGLGWWLGTGDLVRTGAVVTAILVVSCPCAIGLSFPLADEMATVLLRKRGVFVRVTDLWHRLSRVRKLVFDKTGTLTLETPALKKGANVLAELNEPARQALLALVEDNAHPIARCLHEQLLAAESGTPLPGDVSEEIGQGVRMRDGTTEWRLGRAEWAVGATLREAALSAEGDSVAECYLTRNGEPVAVFQFEETARADAVSELRALQARRLTVHVLSGDRRHKVERLVASLGLPESSADAEMTPREKADWIARNGADGVMMLGDGANDSLAFDRALCRGTPVVHRGILAEKADFYYLGRGIEGVRALFEVNDARQRTHWALMIFSITYNALAVGLAIAGHMNPLLAAILMPGSSLASLAIVGLGMKAAAKKV